MNGGGPQGATIGIIEYVSQVSNNTECLNDDRKFKYIDDLSILEVINLISIGLSSYNFKHHVANDIALEDHYIQPPNLQSQSYLESRNKWTLDNKMLLNKQKCKAMIFNFTKNYKFHTRLSIEHDIIEIINETKLLGVILTNDLKWNANTTYLVKKGHSRMRLLHKLSEFSVPIKDLIIIYIIFIRSVCEQSCTVWHSSLTEENSNDLERIKKIALKVI